MTIPKVCCLSNITFDQAVFLTIIHVVDGRGNKKNAKAYSFFILYSIVQQ